MSRNRGRVLRELLTVSAAALSKWIASRSSSTDTDSRPRAKWRSQESSQQASQVDEASPGQFGDGATRDLTKAELRQLRPTYAPSINGEPDPGEVVWTWVPYVEYDGRGKDRPVLIISRLEGPAWAACYLSTKQHHGFISVGRGAWDSKGRESFLAPDRVLRVTSEGMRRESAGIDQALFDNAVAAVRKFHHLT